jgi:hypothetical protein
MTDRRQTSASQRDRQRGAIVLGGAHGSLEIARSLGRRGIPVWLITDDNPLARMSRYVKHSLSWAGPRDGGALSFLLELCRQHDLAGWVLFAGSDDDLCFVAQNHSALDALFTLTTPAWDTIRFACDKRQMNVRAAELGIAIRTPAIHGRRMIWRPTSRFQSFSSRASARAVTPSSMPRLGASITPATLPHVTRRQRRWSAPTPS